jgi:fibronectin-binding autotransporter adhesin
MVGVGTSGIGTYSLGGTGAISIPGTSSGTLGLYVGYNGRGTFNQSGGSVTVGGSSNANVSLAYNASSAGTYLVSGGSLAVNGSVSVGGSSSSADGSAAPSISGGSISVSNAWTIYLGGTLSESAGTLTVGQLIIKSGGILQLSGGTLNAFTTHIQRVGSTSNFGTIQSTSNLTLAGVLALYEDAADEATTTSNQSFTVVQATNGGLLRGAFSNIPSGQMLTTTDDTASFLVTVNSGVDGDVVLSDFQAVPEPSAAGAIRIAAASMLLRRRRRFE